MKKTPLRRTPKRKRGEKAREDRARTLVYARSGGYCECCGEMQASEWHHRQSRAVGGRWVASNGLHLCHSCHQWITAHPAVSYRKGWMVRSTDEPQEVPVVLSGPPGAVYLDDDGGFRKPYIHDDLPILDDYLRENAA